jgi:uncharacterized protein
MSSLDNFRKAARRWLKALRAHDPEAQARLTRAIPAAPQRPVLRDVQHALAREHGHDSWLDLKRALGDRQDVARSPDVAQFEQLAADFLAAWQSGEPNALKRLAAYFRHMVTWDQLRAEVDRQLARLPQSEHPAASLTLTDVHRFLAKAAGFGSWRELVDTLSGTYTAAGKSNRQPIPREREDVASGMLRPVELRGTLPMELPEGEYATADLVWQMLAAAKTGDLDAARTLVAATPGLARCEYNYMPPLHLAVREGQVEIIRFLLDQGAYNPKYVTYPYNETFFTLAEDRPHPEIAALLREHSGRPSAKRGGGASVHGVGHIEFPPDEDRSRLEKLIGANALNAVEAVLDQRPDLVDDEYTFYAEGVLAMVANRRLWAMLELLLARGARVPDVAKWGRFYYFKHADIGAMLLERGMNPDHMTWHRTTLLHDMAGEGNIEKATLLLTHGADINPVDDEFRTTPLGFAARWGRRELVRLLLDHGADPNVAGAAWATPLAWAEKKGHRVVADDLRAAGAK